MDPFYENISAPQFYDFIAGDSKGYEPDLWFDTHKEKNEGEEEIEETVKEEFHQEILPETVFDVMTPPKFRSPNIKPPTYKKMNLQPIPLTKPRVLRKKARKTTMLTIPVSPFSHTKVRAGRKASHIPMAAALPFARSKKKFLKVTEPKQFALHTLKRAMLHNQKKIASVAPVTVKPWKPKLTEPKPFRFRTEERNQVHQLAKGPPSSLKIQTKPKSKPRKRMTLTEPQSPYFRTKQRALHRKHSDVMPVSLHSPYRGGTTWSVFDRERPRPHPVKTAWKPTLTEPHEFTFMTKSRARDTVPLRKMDSNAKLSYK